MLLLKKKFERERIIGFLERHWGGDGGYIRLDVFLSFFYEIFSKIVGYIIQYFTEGIFL